MKCMKHLILQMISSSAFHILGLVTCYGLMPVFEGFSQRFLSFYLIKENLE